MTYSTLVSRKALLAASLSVLVLSAVPYPAAAENRNPERRGISDIGIQGGIPLPESAVDLVKADAIVVARSLFVTHEPSLAKIRLADVMKKLASAGNEPDPSGDVLFRRLWDLNNDKATAVFKDQAHCDQAGPAKGDLSQVNGFSYRCPRPEGREAGKATISPLDQYIPIAAVNRVDLAQDKSCGEFRLVFARKSGVSNPVLRNLIIFEADMPNPFPSKGNAACRPLAQFWHGLKDIPDAATRAQKLKDFFFNGIPGFATPISALNFGTGDGGRGQIRTNQFMRAAVPSGAPWTLREYKLQKTAAGAIRVKPNPLAANPDPSLFGAKSGEPMAEPAGKLADAIKKNMALLAKSAESFSFSSDDLINSADGDEQKAELGDQLKLFAKDGVNPDKSTVLFKRLAALSETERHGLAPVQIVRRVRAMSCAGCHEYSGSGKSEPLGKTKENSTPDEWPQKSPIMSFVHVSERDGDRENCEGEKKKCFGISPTLHNLLLPARQKNMAKLLNTKPAS